MAEDPRKVESELFVPVCPVEPDEFDEDAYEAMIAAMDRLIADAPSADA